MRVAGETGGNNEKGILGMLDGCCISLGLERGIRNQDTNTDIFSPCLKAMAKYLQAALEKCGKDKFSGSGIYVDVKQSLEE